MNSIDLQHLESLAKKVTAGSWLLLDDVENTRPALRQQAGALY